jgi:hypothetical protein
MDSLADFLGLTLPQEETPSLNELSFLTAEEFSKAVLSSPEFYRYIINSLALGTLPSGVLTRLMDYGWGKPPERVEHTGKDGQPIETITEVRRIIVRHHSEVEEDKPQAEHTKVH